MKALLVLLVAVSAAAQSHNPPQVLRIVRQTIKPGAGAEHEKIGANVARGVARAKYPANFLALSSISGLPETWILESHDSFASVEAATTFVENTPAVKWWLGQYEAQSGASVTEVRRMLAIYRPDLSYRGDQFAQDLPKMRYMSVVLVRLLPARDSDFAEAVRLVKEAYEKSASDQPLIIYQVISGAPGPSYLFLAPMASLKTMDDAPARGKAMREALGEDNAAKALKTSAEVTAASESFLFSLNPRLSYVSKEFAAIDPDFWIPKPPPKPATTPGAVPPVGAQTSPAPASPPPTQP
jgi:hypothetical protein